jgi:thiosulfate dehydrogenase [quinone] large subunit
LARRLFGGTEIAWLWLVPRLWLGWEWLTAGWRNVFGGNLTWRVWDWGEAAYSLGGDGNIGWVRSGTVAADGSEVFLEVGDAVAGFAESAIAAADGPSPDVAYGWYVSFLEWVEASGHGFIGPVVAYGELVIGLLLILGAFAGIAAFLGAILNFSFMFAGSAGVNPAMVLISLILIMAWRNAGWIGLDRYLLPRIGVPWQRGTVQSEIPF